MNAKPIRRPYMQPSSNDPGIGQGRDDDRPPMVRKDAWTVIALTVAPWAIGCLAAWAWTTWR